MTTFINFQLSYAPIDCYYSIKNKMLVVKIKSKVPKGMFQSFYNDAISEAIEHYNLNNSISQATAAGEIVSA